MPVRAFPVVNVGTLAIASTVTALLLATGCGAPESPEVDLASRSGVYQIDGVTVQASHGRLRELSGEMELRIEGEKYETRFRFVTTDPVRGDAVPAVVEGKGQGFVVDGTLTGLTQEQIDVENPGQPPSEGGMTIVSTTLGTFNRDGTLHVEIQNYPSQDQRYSPSVTVIKGKKTGPVP